MFTDTGAMKSLISAPKEEDERLFKKVLPKSSHVPAGNTPAAVRLMAASPKSPADRLVPAIGSVAVVVLTPPSAKPAPVRSTCLPQQGRELLEKQSPTLSPCTAVS